MAVACMCNVDHCLGWFMRSRHCMRVQLTVRLLQQTHPHTDTSTNTRVNPEPRPVLCCAVLCCGGRSAVLCCAVLCFGFLTMILSHCSSVKLGITLYSQPSQSILKKGMDCTAAPAAAPADPADPAAGASARLRWYSSIRWLKLSVGTVISRTAAAADD